MCSPGYTRILAVRGRGQRQAHRTADGRRRRWNSTGPQEPRNVRNRAQRQRLEVAARGRGVGGELLSRSCSTSLRRTTVNASSFRLPRLIRTLAAAPCAGRLEQPDADADIARGRSIAVLRDRSRERMASPATRSVSSGARRRRLQRLLNRVGPRAPSPRRCSSAAGTRPSPGRTPRCRRRPARPAARAARRAPRAPRRARHAPRPRPVRDFGSPATIIRSDAPIAPAIAAAVPPPGVGSELARASRKAETGRSAKRDIGQYYLRVRLLRRNHHCAALDDAVGSPARRRGRGRPACRRRSPRPSACPTSRLPTRSARSSDAAALIVAPTSASSSVRFMPKHASVITNGIDGEKPPPGLTSVASATATFCVDQHARRREASELQIERRRRQQRRDHAACRHRSRARPRRRRSDDRPIARRPRRRPPSRRSTRARRRGCATPARAARPASRMRARFVRREDAALAEHVAPLGQAFRAPRRAASRR